MYNEKLFSKEKGITMLTLTLTIVVMIVIMSVITFLCYKFDSSGAVSKIESRCKRNWI